MKNFILIVLLFIAVDILAQTSPSGYTSNYNFRKWASGATPTADSLNANWDDIDTYIKVAYDSAETKINTYSSQSITGGTKSLTGSTAILSINGGRLVFGNSTLTTPVLVGEILPTTSRTYLTYTNSSGTDTLATQEWAEATFQTIVSTPQTLKNYESQGTSDTVLTIDSNVTHVKYTPAVGSGNNLSTIDGGTDGQVIYFILDSASTENVVMTELGNIQIPSATTLTFNSPDRILIMMYSEEVSTGKWLILSSTGNQL